MSNQKIYIKTQDNLTQEQKEVLETSSKQIEVLKNIEYLYNNWSSAEITNNPPKAVFEMTHLFGRHQIEVDTIKVEGIEGIRFPIERIKDKNTLISEIEYENANFNLEKFYREKQDRAICIITEDKVVTAYSWLDHGYAASKVYNYLYNKSAELKDWEWPLWQFEALEKGNIIIQFCDSEYTPVWLPGKINDFQYESIMGMVDELQKIDEKYNCEIELAIDYDSVTPIKEAKDKIKDMCRNQDIYPVPKTK